MDASRDVALGEKLDNGSKVIGVFEDKYEQRRVLLRTRHGVRVQRLGIDGAILMNQAIAPLLAARIKAERRARHWTLMEFAKRLGWTTGNSKERVWAIENATRGHGIRLGTLFLVGETFGIPWRDLLPTEDEVRAAVKARRARAK